MALTYFSNIVYNEPYGTLIVGFLIPRYVDLFNLYRQNSATLPLSRAIDTLALETRARSALAKSKKAAPEPSVAKAPAAKAVAKPKAAKYHSAQRA